MTSSPVDTAPDDLPRRPWAERFSRGQIVAGLALALLLTVLRPLVHPLERTTPLGWLLVAVGVGWLGWALRDSLRDARGRVGPLARWTFAAVVASYLVSAVVAPFLHRLVAGMPGLGTVENLNTAAVGAWPAVELIVAGVVLRPIMEEMVFRGVLFRVLEPVSEVLAHLVVALAFTLLHIAVSLWAGHPEQWIFALDHGLFSLVLTAVYARCRNILPCVLAHQLTNAVGVTSLLLAR